MKIWIGFERFETLMEPAEIEFCRVIDVIFEAMYEFDFNIFVFQSSLMRLYVVSEFITSTERFDLLWTLINPVGGKITLEEYGSNWSWLSNRFGLFKEKGVTKRFK